MAINNISNAASVLPGLSSSVPAASPSAGFANVLKDLVGQTTAATQQAEALSLAAAQGQQVPLHEVIQAVSKAELTLQTLITVRDRAVEAYQQIQQMPI